jgi:uncharacterized protein involved in tolerance to divalent cations
MTEFVVLMTTVTDEASADALADALVAEELAACVQATPITSRYTWKGATQRDREVLLLVKTRAALIGAVEARIKELHAYATPEILAVPVLHASADYGAWMLAQTKAP